MSQSPRRMTSTESLAVMQRSIAKADLVEARMRKVLLKDSHNPNALIEWANALATLAGQIHGQVARKGGIPEAHDQHFLDALRQYADIGSKTGRGYKVDIG